MQKLLNTIKIIEIAAIGKNRELGKGNALLWDLPADMKHFVKLTKGHPIIMGYKTYESIGRLLPKRANIIMTLGKEQVKGAHMAHSPAEALSLAKEHLKKDGGADGTEQDKKIFIIGGGIIYKLMLPYCDELMLTLVNDSPEADVYFPEYADQFKIGAEEKPMTENDISFSFVRLVRK